MIVLSCKNIKKSYGITEVLKDVTFSINDGEKIGFIGPNGAGKSTLFKIITGQMEYDGGELYIDKNKKLGYLSQHLSLDNNNTIYDEMLTVFHILVNMEKKMADLEKKMNTNYDDKTIKDYTNLSELYNTRGGYTYRAEINKVLDGMGFKNEDYKKSISILSGGQKTRVALCKLLLIKPDILLLDEPTNHLDLNAIEWLESYLKDYKGAIITISHDRYFLDSITEKTYELIGGKVECYNGNYSNFISEKKKSYDTRLKAYELQQSEIKRQETIIARYRSFNREKSIRAAESRQKALDKVVKLDKPAKEKKPAKMIFETKIKSGNDIIHIENLSKSFGEKLLFKDVNLDMKREEKNALIGENGRGKTTLFKIIMNKISQDAGSISLGKNVNIGYYDQEQSDLHSEKTVIDEIWDTYPEMTVTEIRTVLGSFLFSNDDVFKKISDLSGGEKCRVCLLKLILSKANFLLLDEPTNHLDIMSREALEDALLQYDGTVLVISHDRYFLNKVVSKIYELNDDGLKKYIGNYTYYVEKKKNPLRFQVQDEISKGKTKTQIELEKKKKREAQNKEKEKKERIKTVENDISNLEEEMDNLNKMLCKEEVYSNPEKAADTNKKIEDVKDKLDKYYEEWETLNE